jgi:rhodanese-related sulfurtransferase
MKATSVTPSQAKEMLERGDPVVFVDARNPVAWGSSEVKLPGAIRIPAEQVGAHLGHVPTGSTVLAYCT